MLYIGKLANVVCISINLAALESDLAFQVASLFRAFSTIEWYKIFRLLS